MAHQLKKTLNLRDIVFLNIVAIIGLRWLSTAAQTGPSSLVLWILSLVCFLIPLGLAVMELSSRMPGEGGIYLWTKQGFGDFHGFVAGWGYWVNNLFYFPSLLIFIAGIFLYLGGDAWLGLSGSTTYNVSFSLIVLWAIVGINIFGMQRGKWVQNIGVYFLWLAFIMLAVFGVIAWLQADGPTALTGQSFVPNFGEFGQLTFFATMTFAFAGFELGPVMAEEIKDPARTIARALVISGVAITAIYIFGTLVLLLAIPQGEINVISGILQAFDVLGKQIGFANAAQLAALFVTLSSIGGLGAWISGTARIPFVIGIDRYLPGALGKSHPKHGSPHIALIATGVLTTLLLLASVVGSTIQEAYVILVDMTIILYFMPYLYMFSVLPLHRERNTGGDGRVYLIPGGTTGVRIVAVVGFLITMLSIVLALVPPGGTENPVLFVMKVGGGCLLFIVAGLLFYWRGSRRNVANEG